MKIKKWIILQFVLLVLVSCGEVEKITEDKKVEKKIKLEFNQSAIHTKESLIFKINDDFDFDNLILLVNGEETIEKTFKVIATKPIIEIPIEVKLKTNAPSGRYNFSVNVQGQSSALDQAMIFKGGEEGFQVTSFEKTKSATEIMILYGIIGIGIILIILLVLFILKRDNMPLGRKTFQKGSISFPNGESPSIRLEGQHRYQVDLSNILGIDPGLILEPIDKYQNKRKKRYARLKNTSDAENILVFDGVEESLSGAENLYHMDEIKIKTNDNRTILFNYMNSKNVRLN